MDLLHEKTLKELGVDTKTLSEQSDQMVYVQCHTCKEIFQRMYSMIDQPHMSCIRYQISEGELWRLPTEYPVRLECKILHPRAKLPHRKRNTDAGYDISSIENVVIQPHKVANIHTGIALAAPPGYFYTIEGRSSMWIKGILPFSAIVDANYNGPVMAALLNITDEPVYVKGGDRIAQIVIHKLHSVDITIVDEFSPNYNKRGQLGHGSSGA